MPVRIQRLRRVAGALWLVSAVLLLVLGVVLVVLAATGTEGSALLHRGLAAGALLAAAIFVAGSAVRKRADELDRSLPRSPNRPTPPEVTP